MSESFKSEQEDQQGFFLESDVRKLISKCFDETHCNFQSDCTIIIIIISIIIIIVIIIRIILDDFTSFLVHFFFAEASCKSVREAETHVKLTSWSSFLWAGVLGD